MAMTFEVNGDNVWIADSNKEQLDNCPKEWTKSNNVRDVRAVKKLFENIKNGHVVEAKKLQDKVNMIILYALKKSGYPFIKMGLSWMGIDSGYVRKPFSSIVNTEIEKGIKDDLKKLMSENDLSEIKFLKAL